MNKIKMIKEVRNLTGCSLREAKDTVEEFQAEGAKPSTKELIDRVAVKVANRLPRSQEYRRYISTAIQRIRDKADSLEGLVDEEWDDFAGARQTLNELSDLTDRLSRLISKLEEITLRE